MDEPIKEENENTSWSDFEIGTYGRPCFGERVSGDWAFADQKDEWVFLAIVDGLGHGPHAHQIARSASEFLSVGWSSDVEKTLQRLHDRLKGSRGAAVGLATLNLITKTLHYVGIGNTVFRTWGASPSRLLSTEGVVGERMRKPHEQIITVHDTDILFLYTDGISESFRFEELPLMPHQSARLTAKTIVRKFGSQFDDATCLVLKMSNES